jgi:hypothetical protein
MENLTHYPLLVLAAAFVTLWLASLTGSWLRGRNLIAGDDQNEDIGVILAATLTLLALIIGFSFSMATNRYDQRKNFEEGEANAIGTEILRADLLPQADAANVRKLLGLYLDQRVQFYTNEDDIRREHINQRTSQLQADLWAAVRGPAAEQPTPIAALVLAGMNDVINSQGYTQAAFWNRIPTAAWVLMAAIALCSNVLFGYRSRKGVRKLFYGTAFCHLDCLASDRRYRCSEAWFDSRQPTEPGQLSEGAWALNLLARQASIFRQISGKGQRPKVSLRANLVSVLPQIADIYFSYEDFSVGPTIDIIGALDTVNLLYEEPSFSCPQGCGRPAPAATDTPSPTRAVSEQHLHAVLSQIRRTRPRSSAPLASRPSGDRFSPFPTNADRRRSRMVCCPLEQSVTLSCHLKLWICGKLFKFLWLPFLHSPRRFCSRV